MRATLQPAPAFASPRVRAAACGPRAAFARPVLEQLIVVEGTRDAEAVRQAVTTQRTPLPREGPLVRCCAPAAARYAADAVLHCRRARPTTCAAEWRRRRGVAAWSRAATWPSR
jgi:hypothetical protein